MARRPDPAPRTRSRMASPGFTLMELMIIVVIISILSTVAIAGFNRAIKRSRAAEASTTLASIAAREEAYRQEFGQYCAAGRVDGTPPTSLGVGEAWPTSSPDTTTVPFNISGIPREWRQLGFTPPGVVRFRYVALAGAPASAPPGEAGWSGSPNQDVWFIAEAYGNVDGDSVLSTYRWFSGEPNRLRITNEME